MIRAKTPLELAALATAAVPGLQVAGLRPPQFSDEVLSVTGIIDVSGNKWTVTCPHDVVGGLDLRTQAALLTHLADAHDAKLLPFDIPRIHGTTVTPEGDRVIVHQDLGGRYMSPEDFNDPHLLPVSMGKALASLHNLRSSVYTDIRMPSYTTRECRQRLLSMLDEAAAHIVIPANLWNRWEAAFDDISLWRFTPAPIHGDLQGNSVIVEANTVRALTGFSSAHVGDPAADIAWILAQASDAFLDRFKEAYSLERSEADLHLFVRAQLLSELALVRWLVHGIHAEDRSIIADARQMLSDLSTDLGDADLVTRRRAPVTPPESITAVHDTATNAAREDSSTDGPATPSPSQNEAHSVVEDLQPLEGESTHSHPQDDLLTERIDLPALSPDSPSQASPTP